ncbi:MAG TPA: type 4a pilus biogenesis protein PilO [Patescibacteria group bacterium]|nr:type 4a pilus biogenesis protein PilO [Patescibacteria group bacterium]
MKIGINKLPGLSKFREFLFPLIVIVLIVLSGVLVVKPKLGEILKVRGELGKQKDELAQLSQKMAILQGYDRSELEARANQIVKVLPIDKNGPLIFASLRSLASENDLEIHGLDVQIGEISTESGKIQTKGNKESFPSLTISLSVSGDRGDLYEFFKSVESISPLMRIRQISLNQEEDIFESKLELETYYLASPEFIGKADRTIIPISSEEEEVYQKIKGYLTVLSQTSLPLITSGKENPFTY